MSNILNGHVQDDQHEHVKPRQPSSALPFFTYISKREEVTEHNPSLAESGISVCNAVGCNYSTAGKNTGILINHLKHHKMEYAKFMSKFKEKSLQIEPVHSNVNTVETTMKVQPVVKEEKIESSPVSHVNEATSLSSPNLTENSVTELSVQQEASQTQYQWKLPLNSPIPVPVFFPSGTTLIVLDPSTLAIVLANSSPNFPAKLSITSSSMPSLTCTNNPPIDATSSVASRTLPSQSTANSHSSVGGISLAISELTANNLNQTISPSGSSNVEKPYIRSSRIVPIEHIRLQALPAASIIAMSASTETANIVENIPATDSIPSIQLISQSRDTISSTEANHKPLEAVREQLNVATLISPNVLQQPLQIKKDKLLAAQSEIRERLKSNSRGDCASKSLLNGVGKSLPVATGITIASFAKIDESKGIVDSNISKMCMPVKCVNTDLPLMPPLTSIVSCNEPLEASTASSSPGSSNDKSSGEIEKISREGSHPVFQFFKFNGETGRSECLVDGCGFSRNGKNPSNLINHLRQKHPKKEYAEFMAKWTTMWARPKRKAAIVNTTNMLPPSKTLRSTRAKKPKKNSPIKNEKEMESVPAPLQTRKPFPVILTSLVSKGSMVPRGSFDVGSIGDKKLSVGSNILQAILKNNGNSAVLGYRKDFFNEKMHPVYRYFTFHEAANRTECPAEDGECGKSVCDFQGCNVAIKGNKPASLIIHLNSKHGNTKEYAEFLSLNEEFEAQRHQSMTKSSDPNKPGKRPRAQTEDEKACKDYFELRKKQREHFAVGTTLSSPSLVKGMTITPVQNFHPTNSSFFPGQQSSLNIANKTTAVPFPAHIPNQELNFIGPDTPTEYYSSFKTAGYEQPLPASMFPQRQPQQFTGVSEPEKEPSTTF